MDLAVLVPVKDFRQAKARLAGIVPAADRITLARWMAGRVLAAAAGTPTFVVCDSDEVAAWAEAQGATVLWAPGVGLNAAATDGLQAVAERGFDHAVVAHSDLPLAHSLASIATPGTVTLVPDGRDDGTNVMSLPAGTGFRFSYGARSFLAHQAEAAELGLEVVIRRDEALALDVDTEDDLRHPLVRPLIREVLPTWEPTTNPASPR